ncbi:MAG: CHAP domain-containing protein [Oscillospiraceae bacterium]|nr:CHAP domain-containing protein [Oscillospiraceae bacterium]
MRKMVKEHTDHASWLWLFLLLAAFVIALAFAMVHKTVSAQTYTKRVFACPYAEEGAERVAHTHNDDCYENGVLICTLPELEAHTHTDACYTEEKVLICDLEESDGHVHTEDCYILERGDLTCENTDPEHEHTDECYEWIPALNCGMDEGDGAHHHSDECYEIRRELSCGKEELSEHVHTVDCFEVVDMSSEDIEEMRISELPESDPYADVETADEWESRFANIRLTGHWDADLLTIAETQIGYTESARNFEATLNEDDNGYTQRGWTRYGAWYGIPYGDWSAMFVSFCLNYADIPVSAVPQDGDAASLANRFSDCGLYASASDYIPKPGDLIFLDRTGDGMIDHVGIVYAVDADNGLITAIEGDRTDSVAYFDYNLSDYDIMGYGILPENPDAPEETVQPEENPTPSEDEAEAAAREALEKSMPAVSFTERAGAMRVTVEADVGAFPAGTTMKVVPITDEGLADTLAPAIIGEIVEVQAVDITFYDADGNEIEPLIPIRVMMRPFDETEADNVDVVHVDNEGNVTTVELPEDLEQPDQGVAFDADAFSMYAIVYSVKRTVISSSGQAYDITVTYDESAGVPEGAELVVEEILPDAGAAEDGSDYDSYVEMTREALGLESGEFAYARFFDIKIVDPAGEKVSINAPVAVKIELADKETDEASAENTMVVHFPDEGDTPDIVQNVNVSVTESAEDVTALSFKTSGFSIYAIVEPSDLQNNSPKDISELDGKSFYLSVNDCYFSNEINNIGSNNNYTLIKATDSQNTVQYTFEAVPDFQNQFAISCLIEGMKKYVKMEKYDNDYGTFSFDDDPTAFTVALYSSASHANDYFVISYSEENTTLYWNLRADNGENSGFQGYSQLGTGCQIKLSYPEDTQTDPLHLDNQTFGIIYYKTGMTGVALGSTAYDASNINAQELLVRPDVSDHDGVLFEYEKGVIAQWTFHYVSPNQYYISTLADGTENYLAIYDNAVTLVNDPDRATQITVTPGSDTHAGRYQLSCNGKALNLTNGKAADGFGAANQNANTDTEWMNLVGESENQDMAFTVYTAQKADISASASIVNGDKPVTSGDTVIIYTRIWNYDTLEYDYYVVDYDGKLFRAYESGDVIQWVGEEEKGKPIKAEWTFTECTEGEGSSTGFFALENFNNEYLMPKLSDSEILRTKTSDTDLMGIELPGRINNEHYTKVVSKDDNYNQYAGLKAENGKIVSVPMTKSDDFYFAIIQKPETEFHYVTTVDNNVHGIQMFMQDYPYQGKHDDYGYRSDTQSAVLNRPGIDKVDSNNRGIVKPYLESNGYPDTHVNGHNLIELYSEEYPVNHLFIESTHNESGYFEYDSTQNFASLTSEMGSNGTDFVVINELGTNDSNNNWDTRKHGMFMPYNYLNSQLVSKLTNDTDTLGNPLSDLDPRKHEQLYKIPAVYPPAGGGDPKPGDADYFFGMEMRASFMQTANGLDNWGHDIIFEFSGDDDFWLYVDGYLVLDLGGVHSASAGTVNFRTGDVYYTIRDPKGNVIINNEHTTLRELFKTAYKAQYPEEADSNVEEWLNGIFKDGGTVFNDYSSHEMKMFYMERGASSSNLHMRFNLAPVEPGQIKLTKTVSGTDKQDYLGARFAYQIEYETDNGWTKLSNPDLVTISGSNKDDFYKPSLEIGDVEYDNVFLLSPGQTAVIRIPGGDDTKYRIKECGIQTTIYDEVKANNVPVEGVASGGLAGYEDFPISEATVRDRKQVVYDNHVEEGSLRNLQITKKLYDVEENEISNSDQTFSFQVRFGEEDILYLADGYYYVLNSENYYCTFNSDTVSFESTNEKSFDQLVKKGLEESARFRVSPTTGKIENIPVGYTVEIRNLIPGTYFHVEECDVPAGYKLLGYEMLSDGGNATYVLQIDKTDKYNFGIIREIETTAHVLVKNQMGWGLTINKIWSDKDSMESHDTIYFAVYVDGEIVEDTLRKMTTNESSLYYYFDNLAEGAEFSDYKVYEVQIDGEPETNDEGYVTNWRSLNITPVDGQNVQTIIVGGTPKGGAHEEGFTYTASYTTGTPTGTHQNTRVDTVKNTRPGIKLIKTDMSGAAVGGAEFELEFPDGETTKTYTSDANEGGLITTIYQPGEYILTETKTPKGWQTLTNSLKITVSVTDTYHVEVTEVGQDNQAFDQTDYISQDGNTITVAIKNRPYTLKAIKYDASSKNDQPTPMAGIQFALYKGTVSDSTLKAEGFTDNNGVIPGITEALEPGTYILVEKAVPERYEQLPPLKFTIRDTGEIQLEGNNGEYWELTFEDDENTQRRDMVLKVYNHIIKQKIRIIKMDEISILNEEQKVYVGGAGFTLGINDQVLLEDLISQASNGVVRVNDGSTDDSGDHVFTIPIGKYSLNETVVPAGYIPLSGPVTIQVDKDGVSYQQPDVFGGVPQTARIEKDAYTVYVYNSAGYELPASGGSGTALYTALGGLMTATAGAALVLCRKKKEA